MVIGGWQHGEPSAPPRQVVLSDGRSLVRKPHIKIRVVRVGRRGTTKAAVAGREAVAMAVWFRNHG